jgi:hypothetical protein
VVEGAGVFDAEGAGHGGRILEEDMGKQENLIIKDLTPLVISYH